MRNAASASATYNMRCYTRNGDEGKTCIFGGRVDKHDERIDAIGSIDELNSFLGAAASFCRNETAKKILHDLQNDMFSIGAELATVTESMPAGKVAITPHHVEKIEAMIDKIDSQLPQQTKFIIPAGTQAAMMLNVCRTVTRRAERSLVKLDRESKLNPQLLKYANRLSSLMHVLMRFENSMNNVQENNPVYHYVK